MKSTRGKIIRQVTHSEKIFTIPKANKRLIYNARNATKILLMNFLQEKGERPNAQKREIK